MILHKKFDSYKRMEIKRSRGLTEKALERSGRL